MEQSKEKPQDLKETIELVNNEITESLIGLTALYPELGIFNFGNVVVQKNFNSFEGVRIISGSSSGFEPLFAGYVGKGMLMAAIQGDMYTSPPVKLIIRTFRELNHNHMHGLLALIQCNPGDQLSFGLAVTKAKNERIRMKLLMVSESCMNKDLPERKKHGLAGVVLVQKIAGAMAEKKELLKDIYQYCEKVVAHMSSAIISAEDVTPQREGMCICRKRVPENTMELGKGLQGEPGVKKTEASAFPVNAMYNMINAIIQEEKIKLNSGDSVIVLLGNIGKISKLEEWTLVKDTITLLKDLSVKVAKFYLGNYMTSKFYMGVTLTILKLYDPQIIEYLDYPCSAPAWIAMKEQHEDLNFDNIIPSQLRRKTRKEAPLRGPNMTEKESNVMILCTTFACEALISCENQLNIIDSESGDGDTGTRLKKTCQVILNRLKENKLLVNSPFAFFDGLAQLLESLIGGSMGALYGIMFRSLSNCFGKFSEDEAITPNMWLTALEMAVGNLKMPCVEYGDGTMYDPLYTFALNFRLKQNEYVTPMEAFSCGLASAEEAVELSKKNRQYPDSGAHAVGIWLRAVYEGVKLRCQ